MAAAVPREFSQDQKVNKFSSKISFEVKLAQSLAGNEKTKRDRALKKLRKWMQVRAVSKTNPFTRNDLLKVWKGLHYCMWMSDKPLVQEDLAEQMSGLIHAFKDSEMMLMWLDVFLETEAREWNGIDRLRLDKFMMLIRYVIRQSLGYMKRCDWPADLIDQWLSVLFRQICSVEATAPDGLKLHVIDMMFDELTLVGADDLTKELTSKFLHPFCLLLSKTKSPALSRRLINSLFISIIKDSAVGLDERELSQRKGVQILEVDYQALADDLFAMGSAKHCTGKNRKLVYNMVKKFRDMGAGVFPVEEFSSGEEDEITYDTIRNATKSLRSFDQNLLRSPKSKKKKRL